MEAIFMNTENSKTDEPHRFSLILADKLNLKDPNKNMALANLSIHYTWKKIKSAYNYNKFEISASAWNDEFDLSNDPYSISGSQDYFEYINVKFTKFVKYMQIYTNKIKNRIVFKIKTNYKLELLSPQSLKLLGSRK